MNLYITADKIGLPTGGGAVTFHEAAALKEMGAREILDRTKLEAYPGIAPFEEEEPWLWDFRARASCSDNWDWFGEDRQLAHFYAGTFTQTIKALKAKGCKITYTAAAHDVEISKSEHEKLGIPFNYPHLTDPALWEHYVRGYLEADVLICPSHHSAKVMTKFGYKKEIEIIPHGCHVPEGPIAELPEKFTVGYLGTCGAPDKGLVYLLQAWKRLNIPDAKLVLGGADSQSPWVTYLVQQFGGSNIEQIGWVDNVSTFYNSLALYVQPSMTEGFGLEVIEAKAHGRPVICSTGAGAVDATRFRFEAGSVDQLMSWLIHMYNLYEAWMKYKKEDLPYPDRSPSYWKLCQEVKKDAYNYTWERIRSCYIKVWKELLS